MADKSLIAELLMTPSEVRKREEAELRQQALNRQSNFGRNMGGVASMFANYGGTGAENTRQALRLGGEALGLDMRSPAEKQAAANQGIVRTAVGGNLQQLEKLREKLMNDPRSDPRAIAAVTSRINAEKKREADLKDNDFNKLTAGDKTAIREASQAARMARLDSNKALDLANQYAEAKPTGGVFGDVFSAFKEFVGGTDEVNMMRTKFNNIIMSGVLDSLPDGPASDTDIRNAQKGFPNERFSPDQITSFLIGYAKAKRIEAGYQKFYAKWLSDNKGDSAGVEEAWAKHFEENEELYWTDDSKSNKSSGGTGTKPGSGAGSSTFDPELVPPGTEGLVTSDVVNQVNTQPGASPGTMTVPSMYNPRVRRGVLR